MIVKAILKNARISSQKIKPLIDKIRGLNVTKAMNILQFSNKKSAFLVKKVLNSAVANAENNNNLNIEKLYIYEIYATNGTNLKRLKIRAKGRSDRMIRRNAHIYIYIKEQE